MKPSRTQLKMALNGLGWARLDEPFRRAFGNKSLEHAMAGLAIKPGVFDLMIEQLEQRGVEFREDGSVKGKRPLSTAVFPSPCVAKIRP